MVNGMAAINKHGQPTKEILEIFKKNGSLQDYIEESKKNPPERYSEDEIRIDFYRMLS
jgi:hypothetical protein